ncbi:tetratricopeptide repeat protein [Thermoflexibacter ruber]|uniref:Serine phosphatase RsbU, regulator of sigma subunit n=1 Tax=Thermoflexibacter ruber TaxID=1003 RepID=A0A1I2H587_9BACT|nr:tetratricopeptide repeat protein [Thermoflexibacter ruber]SFF25305.1 Serine phosphatase RsbU, regulator of sigma subunit [Thermoflexibacter ruber]
MKKYYYISLLLFGLLFLLVHITHGQAIEVLLNKLDTEKDLPKRSELMYQIANEYQQQGAYKKAVEYYEKSLETYKGTADEVLAKKRKIVQSHVSLKAYKEAIHINEELLEYYRTHAREEEVIGLLNENSEYCQYENLYDKALIYNAELLKIYEKRNDLAGLNQVYNNLGIIYRRQGSSQKSVESFSKAIEVNKTMLKEKKSTNQIDAFLQINAGVTYLQLKDYKKANYYFEEAIKVADNHRDMQSQAAAYNYGAMSHYLSDENGLAITYASKSLSIAEENKDYDNLLTAYQILSQIYQSEENYKEAQSYQSKYQELKARLEKQKQQAIQEALEKEIAVERKESELKSLIAEKDRQEAALRQSELERQKQEQELKLRENELVLLRRNQELQAVRLKAQEAEKQRIEQLLELTKQKAETERQRLLAEAQAQEAEQQRLIARQKQIESNAKSRDLLMARAQQKLQIEKFEQEKYIRYLGIGVIILVLGILFFVYRGLRITKKLNNQLSEKNQEIERANISLKEKQEEINVQNEELQQSQEEVVAQRDALEQANKKLEKNNQDIKDSITYASRIQEAVLPSTATFQSKLPHSFVLYKPRDIVSGDFYWIEKAENKIILVVADCTGHGVPGAFMSMLGSAGISEIVFQKHIIEPNEILNALHLYIRQYLKQDENQGRDGMDVAIVTIDQEAKTLTYAGAKNPIAYIQNNELQLIKGDKMPIGGEQREINRLFTKHTIPIDVPTTFYLFSDGYQDQFGGKDSKKFSSAKMRDLLFQVHQEDMRQQKLTLQYTIEKWIEDGRENQLDDILVVGVRL